MTQGQLLHGTFKALFEQGLNYKLISLLTLKFLYNPLSVLPFNALNNDLLYVDVIIIKYTQKNTSAISSFQTILVFCFFSYIS